MKLAVHLIAVLLFLIAGWHTSSPSQMFIAFGLAMWAAATLPW